MALSSGIACVLRGALRTRSLVPQNGSVGAAVASLSVAHVLSRSMASCKLFIGGLAWGVDEMSLRTAFESYGQLTDAKVIIDRETGRSRGFGFVSFTSEEEAKAAVEAMDGKDLGGRSIRVDYASERPMAPRRDLDNFNDILN